MGTITLAKVLHSLGNKAILFVEGDSLL